MISPRDDIRIYCNYTGYACGLRWLCRPAEKLHGIVDDSTCRHHKTPSPLTLLGRIPLSPLTSHLSLSRLSAPRIAKMMNKGNLSYGLNARSGKGDTTTKKKKKGLSGFGGGDDSDDDSSDDKGISNNNARSSINKEIAAEQAALRKRAQSAMAKASLDTNVYDYDAEYDTFSSGKKMLDAIEAAKQQAKLKQSSTNEPKKSKYISSLLKTAERRNQEQEIIYEKSIIKEQSKEDTQYEGKDKFITTSYKRKLAEREQWAKEEKERTKNEEENDVTKKKVGVGSFMFGGIGRSLLLGSSSGGGNAEAGDYVNNNGEKKSDKGNSSVHELPDDNKGKDGGQHDNNEYQRRESSTRDTEHRWDGSNNKRTSDDDYYDSNRKRPPPINNNNNTDGNLTKDTMPQSSSAVKTRKQILEERAIKISEAKERYFKRRGLTPTQ